MNVIVRIYIEKIYDLEVSAIDEEEAIKWALSDEISPAEIEATGTFVGYATREFAELVEEDLEEYRCPRCGETDNGDTTIADHGMCFACHRKWQLGELEEGE